MSEAIGEMILPGTYIEVRAEGLIGVGGISTGNIGVVGTANRGKPNEVKVLGSYSEALETFGSYDRWPDSGSPNFTLTRTLEQVFKGGGSTVYAVRVANGEPKSMSWTVEDGAATPAKLFTLTATSPGSWANDITATLTKTPGSPPGPVTIELKYKQLKETFSGANAGELIREMKASRLVEPSEATAVDAPKVPDKITPATGAGNIGSDAANATATEIGNGLGLLANEPVNIIAIGGLSAANVTSTVLGHLEATENDGHERLAVLGVSGDELSTISNNAALGSNPRLILVAPGILADDAARVGEADKRVKLTAPYAAALVAGRLSTLAPHISLTNKDVAADGLTKDYTRAEQKNLLGKQVLVLQKNLGIRVLKGITTDTAAFRQITTRRIVDYAKAGVRIGSNPYIGRLNNSRVRGALQVTLDSFLASMVLDEMLISYELQVTATRAQEIVGQALVTMTLRPTFSIDFIKVIMNLE